jgi:L-amino acid N-acyltransferase YncA
MHTGFHASTTDLDAPPSPPASTGVDAEPSPAAPTDVDAPLTPSTTTDLEIRPFRDEDWPAVHAIYAQGIATGDATFETEVPAFERWSATHPPAYRFVAARAGEVTGWVAASPVSDRCAYAGVLEHSVYVAAGMHGQGIGRRLLETLIAHADATGIWTIQSGVFPENVASLELHRRCGFRVVGTRERLGQLKGTWRDVILIERRKP